MTLYASPFPLQFSGRVLDVLLQSRSDGVLVRVALALLEALQSELLALDDFEAIITSVKVTPLQWPVDVYRHVLDRALSHEFLSQTDLRAAHAAAVAEAARLGRPSSFSTRRLLRTYTAGGTERVELSPVVEPTPGGAAAAAAGIAAAAVGADGLVSDGSGTAAGGVAVGVGVGGAGTSVPLPPGLASSLEGAAAAAAGSGCVGAGTGLSGSGGAAAVPPPPPELSELGGEFEAFEAILHDLQLILPGGGGEEEGEGGSAAGGGGGSSSIAGASVVGAGSELGHSSH